jgi:hypothetical protein
MDIEVTHMDSNNNSTQLTFKLSTLGLIKHFGLAGQSYGTTVRAIRRAIGTYFLYHDYFKRADLINSRFSQPPAQFYDPTDQGDFSTLAGRAIADFLARRIDGATHTFTYEGAMLMAGHNNVNIPRPDLYCFNSSKQFAVESKGFEVRTVSENEMQIHKVQSKQGPLNIQSSAASVSFNLYRKIKNKYYDPISDNFELDNNLNRQLSIDYYSGFAELVKEQREPLTLNFSEQGREFNLIPLYSPDDDFIFYDKIWRHRFYRHNTVFLVLDKRIKNFAIEGFINNEVKNEIAEDGLYIDNDGIGLMLDY